MGVPNKKYSSRNKPTLWCIHIDNAFRQVKLVLVMVSQTSAVVVVYAVLYEDGYNTVWLPFKEKGYMFFKCEKAFSFHKLGAYVRNRTMKGKTNATRQQHSCQKMDLPSSFHSHPPHSLRISQCRYLSLQLRPACTSNASLLFHFMMGPCPVRVCCSRHLQILRKLTESPATLVSCDGRQPDETAWWVRVCKWRTTIIVHEKASPQDSVFGAPVHFWCDRPTISLEVVSTMQSIWGNWLK